MPTAMLRIRQLSFLDWAPSDLEIPAATCVGIVGTSGSGKSLFLRALADLDVHSGGVEWRGQASASMPAQDWRHMVGLLPAESAWWYDSVGEHFLPETDPGGLLARLGFEPDVLDWEILRLSAGEKQRLALARLLVRGPEVLLLDEPTANLDVAATDRVESLVRDYRLENGAAVIWVSHSRGQLDRVADRIFEMAQRRLREVATP